MRMPKSINTLKRQIDAKIRSLGEAGTFMSGSLIQKRWKCAKPDCICNRTGKLHTGYAVTSKVKGRDQSAKADLALGVHVGHFQHHQEASLDAHAVALRAESG